MPIPAELPETISFYQNILTKNGIKDKIVDFSSEACSVGKYKGAFIEHVKLQLKTDESSSDVLTLHVKKAATEGVMAKLHKKEDSFFEREAFFYNKFLPDAINFVKDNDKYQDINFNMFPKCYHADDAVIILEKLDVDKWKGLPITEPHSFMQAEEKVFHVFLPLEDTHFFESPKATLEALGTFHGVTRAMILTIGLDEFQARYSCLLDKNEFNPKCDFNSKYWENVIQFSLYLLKDVHIGVENEDVGLEPICDFQEMALKKLSKVIDDDVNADLMSLNHGWIINPDIFFLPDYTKRIYSDKIIFDWQDTKLGSPLLDFSMYAFGNVEFEVILSNLIYLMDIFYEFLRETSKALNVHFNYKLEDIKQEYFKRSVIGILNTCRMELVTNFPELESKETLYNLDFESWKSILATKDDEAKIAAAKTIHKKILLYCKLQKSQST